MKDHDQPTDEALLELAGRVRELLRDMPREDDYGKAQALMTLLLAAIEDPNLSCPAFARSEAILMAKSGQRVHVHVLSERQTVVFEGETGTVRRFQLDPDGQMVELDHGTTTTLQ